MIIISNDSYARTSGLFRHEALTLFDAIRMSLGLEVLNWGSYEQ
jgi:hypothetical protein